MSRTYGEPVDVLDSGGRPTRFVWRGRIYVVHRVLEHWATTSGTGLEGGAERRFWRVEAAAGKEVKVCELRYDTATGQWLLSRAWD